MSTWTSGYVADIGYTHGFYRELTPSLLSFVMLIKGLRSPDVQSRSAYCELGCGQGFSANLLAAANPQIDFYATDFNPAQIAGAQALAAAAGTNNVSFYDASFADFASEPSLPPAFDVIALHGIYSWINVENRRYIVDFIRRKLKPGGLVYISYNTLPGWAAAMPLRRLMSDHAAGQGAGPITARIDDAIAFAEKVRNVGSAYFTQNAQVGPRLDKLKTMSRNYLAHEYFNKDWEPSYFSDVALDLSEAKLSYVGSAALLENIDIINLNANQQSILKSIGDPVRRESVRDFMVGQQFRRDVFVKGTVPHSILSSREAWADLRFTLSTIREDVPLKVNASLGEATLQEEFYTPILDLLAKGPATTRQISSLPEVAKLPWASLAQALTILVGAGHVHPSLSGKDDLKRSHRTKAFNAVVCKQAEASGDLLFLASPVTGGGVSVERFHQLFLAARTARQDPVEYTWKALSAQNQKILRDGKALETADENKAELKVRYDNFVERRLPILKQVGID